MNFQKPKALKRSSFISLPILLLCLCLLFSSCANSQTGINEHSLYLPDSMEEDTSENIDFFFFILPKDASPELIESAKTLCEKFCTENGVRAKVYFDDEALPKYKNPRFILIGDTAYASSHKAIAHLNRDDYVCLSIERDVIIGGKSNSASILAIERFTKEVFPYFDGESGISSASAFEFFAEYPHKDLTINGYSLSDYTFVYPSENSMKEMEITYFLREKLADTCGAYPKILSDKDADKTGRLICIGNCFGETRSEPQIAYEGNSVRFFASSSNTLAQAAEIFIKELEGTQNITLRDKTPITQRIPEIDFKSIFADKIENEGDIADIINVCKEIKQTLPMLVCFDFPSNTELEQYKKNLKEYSYIGNGLFILSSKNEILSLKSEGNVLVADIRIGNGLDYSIIVADTRGQSNDKEISELAISKISDNVTTVLYTLSNSTKKPSFERNDNILELQSKDGERAIYISVFAPIGVASVDNQAVIIHHSILKDSILKDSILKDSISFNE